MPTSAVCSSSSLLMIQVPNGASSGGNSRGALSLDFSYDRSNSARVASGASANSLGSRDTVVGDWCTAIGCDTLYGLSNAASAGVQRVVIQVSGNGNSLVAPSSAQTQLIVSADSPASANTTQGDFRFSSPGYVLDNVSKFVHSFGCTTPAFVTNSIMATRRIIYGISSGTTPVVLTADGAALDANNNLGTTQFNTCQMLEVRYIAIAQTASINTIATDYAVGYTQIFSTKGATAATQTATSSFNTVTSSGGAASGWSVTVAANTTLGCPTFSGTGSAGLTVRWMAFVMTAEVQAQA